MFIDHATADLRTDAAWPDLYAEYRQDPRDSVDHVAPRLRHNLIGPRRSFCRQTSRLESNGREHFAHWRHGIHRRPPSSIP